MVVCVDVDPWLGMQALLLLTMAILTTVAILTVSTWTRGSGCRPRASPNPSPSPSPNPNPNPSPSPNPNPNPVYCKQKGEVEIWCGLGRIRLTKKHPNSQIHPNSQFPPRSLGHAPPAPELSARMQHMTRRVARQLHSSTGLRARGLASAASGAPRPFRVLGLQQVAIGGLDKGPLTDLWQACTQAQTRTQSLPLSLSHSLPHSLSRTPAH